MKTFALFVLAGFLVTAGTSCMDTYVTAPVQPNSGPPKSGGSSSHSAGTASGGGSSYGGGSSSRGYGFAGSSGSRNAPESFEPVGKNQ
jgi:hypothetical protein